MDLERARQTVLDFKLTRTNYTNVSFSVTSLILLLILAIRSTRGLDFTDEMQYYGQIKGLLDSGKLFSNDLFIQQSVYILLYPAFAIYHWGFGSEGLVFFGRLFMSAISVLVFLYAYQKLLNLNVPRSLSSLTALSLVFAIPYHGIFAPSYNTISQALWIVFTVRFLEWKRSGALSWSILPITMSFAHPVSAIIVSLLILIRLLAEGDFRQIGRLLLVLGGGALLSMLAVFHFASPQEYLTSIEFSRAYGVGAYFFSNTSQPITMMLIYGIFLSCSLFRMKLSRLWISIFLLLCLAVAIFLVSTRRFQWGYTPGVAHILSLLSALAYGFALSNLPGNDSTSRKRIHWLVVLLLVFATTIAVTSGNGIGQTTGAFMVGLPLLLSMAAMHGDHNGIWGFHSVVRISCVILLSVLFVLHWTIYPYREDSWWRTNQPIQSVPEFKLIHTSQKRSALIHQMQNALGPIVRNKRTLIVGDLPGLYFALNTLAETCMLYMHSLRSVESQQVLLDCLGTKSPEVVIDFSPEGTQINRLLNTLYNSREFEDLSVPVIRVNGHMAWF